MSLKYHIKDVLNFPYNYEDMIIALIFIAIGNRERI